MAGIVVVFDFDKTIIECDSDNWVVDELGATDLFNQLLPTMPWNSLMVCFRFLCIINMFMLVFLVQELGEGLREYSLGVWGFRIFAHMSRGGRA